MSFQLRSRDGSEYLIQHDSEAIISTWYKAIAQGIQELVGRAWGFQGWWGDDDGPLCRADVPTVGGALHSGTGSSMAPVDSVPSCRCSAPLWLDDKRAVKEIAFLKYMNPASEVGPEGLSR